MVHLITTIERGGAEHAILALAKIQVEKGYEVTIIPLKGKLELLSQIKMAAVNIDTSIMSMNFLAQIRHISKSYGGDNIFHAHLPRAELLARFSLSKYRYFVTRHNAEQFFPQSNRYISAFLSRFVLKKSLGVIFISKAVRDFLYLACEIPRDTPNQVIYYGYTKRLSNLSSYRLVERPLNRKLFLVTVSRLSPQKNLQLLLDLAHRLKREHINFHLQIVGEGSDRNDLENRVKNLGLIPEVEFLGKIADVPRFLKSKDLFVLTTNYEGFGLVLLEAMDAQLPIIAPRNSAIPEVIGENHPGLFVSGDATSLYNTLMLMLTRPSLQRDTVKLQSARLPMFDLESYFRLHHTFYAANTSNLGIHEF